MKQKAAKTGRPPAEILRLAAVMVYGHDYRAWRILMDAMAYLVREEAQNA